MPIFSIRQRQIATRSMLVDARTRAEAMQKARDCDALEIGDFRESTNHEIVSWSNATMINGAVVRSANLKEADSDQQQNTVSRHV